MTDLSHLSDEELERVFAEEKQRRRTAREDAGRQARPTVFLDDAEHPQTLHEVARIILTCQDRPLDDNEIVDIEQERQEREAEDRYTARVNIEKTIEIARRNVTTRNGVGFSDILLERMYIHLRLAQERGKADPVFAELAEQLKSLLTDEDQPN